MRAHVLVVCATQELGQSKVNAYLIHDDALVVEVALVAHEHERHLAGVFVLNAKYKVPQISHISEGAAGERQ